MKDQLNKHYWQQGKKESISYGQKAWRKYYRKNNGQKKEIYTRTVKAQHAKTEKKHDTEKKTYVGKKPYVEK